MAISPELKARFEKNLGTFDTSFAKFEASFPRSKGWLSRESGSANSIAARSLLAGARLAILDAGAAWSMGSNRGAASALRAFIENCFAWLYYKDHAVEFSAMNRGASDLMLPKAVQTYLKSIDEGFDNAHTLLARTSRRTDDYYYSKVSQYVHAHPGQNKVDASAPEMTVSVPPDGGFLAMLEQADEFISDFYAIVWRKSWDDIPIVVQKDLSTRLGAKLSKFVEE